MAPFNPCGLMSVESPDRSVMPVNIFTDLEKGFFLISIKKTRLIDWLLLITFTILGAMAIRNIPLFAITVFIPFTTHLTSILHLCFQNVTKKWRTHLYYGTYLLIVALIGSSIFQVLQKGTGGAHLPSGGEKAVTFFLTNNLHGPIF